MNYLELSVLAFMAAQGGNWPVDLVKTNQIEMMKSLIDRGFLKMDEEGGEYLLTSKAKTHVSFNRTGLNFKELVGKMNYNAQLALWDPLLSTSSTNGLHINVVLANLGEDVIKYLETEIADAREKIEQAKAVSELINE